MIQTKKKTVPIVFFLIWKGWKIGWVNFGHFYLRPKRELAHYFYKYNTPLYDLRFIISLKTVGYFLIGVKNLLNKNLTIQKLL